MGTVSSHSGDSPLVITGTVPKRNGTMRNGTVPKQKGLSPRYVPVKVKEDKTQMSTADSRMMVPAFLMKDQDFSLTPIRTLRTVGMW